MSYYRRVSPGERVFHLTKETEPFSRKFLQVIIEGEGQLKLSRWQAALPVLMNAHPGAHVILKGHLGFTYWDSSGPVQDVMEITTDWDGFDFTRAPFLISPPVDLRKDPVMQILLLH